MRKVALIFLLFSFIGGSTQPNIPKEVSDSLWSVWENEDLSDSIRLRALRKYNWEGYLFTKPDSAFYYAQIYFDYAKSKGLKREMADALSIQGISFDFRSDFDEAINYHSQSLLIYKEIDYKLGISNSLNNLGMIYDKQGNYIKALDYHSKSLRLREEVGYQKGVASSTGNIGNIYKAQEEYDKAIEYLTKSLNIFKELDYKRNYSIALENIGLCYEAQGKFEKAQTYFEECLVISEEIGDIYGVATSYINLSIVYKDKKEYDKSMEYNNKSLKLSEEMGDKQGMAICLGNIGYLFFLKKEYNEAIINCDKAVSISLEIGVLEQAKLAYKTLFDIYKVIGNHEKALKMHELYIETRDSLKNDNIRQAVIHQEYEYEYEKQKAIDDKENEKLVALEKEEKEKQLVITYATFGGLGLVLIFLAFVFNRLQVSRKQKLIIEETNEELNQTNEELAAQRDEIEKQKEVVEEAHQEIKDSINYAKRIQNAILPAASLIKEHLPESFVLYNPKDVVAGDFYWLEYMNDKTLFAAADCTGHGVPGAMVSVVCHNAMNRAVREFGLTEPGLILDKTREIVVAEFEKSEDDVKDGMDIALCSLSGNILQYSGAHNPLWIVRNNEILETKADKQPIGKFDNPVPYKTHTIEIEKGDSIYIFSDGYVDQFGGEKDKKFGSKRLKELLLSIQDKTMNEQKLLLEQKLNAWMTNSNSEQLDDICIMGVNI